MTRCASDGCQNEATHAPKICVPASGYPQTEKQSLVSIMGIKLCEQHCQEFPAQEQFFSPECRDAWRGIFLMMARAAGSNIPPDFHRAFVVPAALDSDDYLMFEKMQAGASH